MELNSFRDEVAGFNEKMSLKGNVLSLPQVIDMLDEEIALLKESIDDGERLTHQVYDVLFLLFGIAAVKGMDLDTEWARGREKKRIKYLEN